MICGIELEGDCIAHRGVDGVWYEGILSFAYSHSMHCDIAGPYSYGRQQTDGQ